MNRRGAMPNFVVYGLITILLGLAIMTALSQIGKIGHSDSWVRINLARNIALTPRTYSIISGNAVIKANYDLSDSILEVNNTMAAVYKYEDKVVKSAYGYRIAGYPDFEGVKLTRPEVIEIIKTNSLKFNEEFNIDALNCIPFNGTSHETIKMSFTDDFSFTIGDKTYSESEVTGFFIPEDNKNGVSGNVAQILNSESNFPLLHEKYTDKKSESDLNIIISSSNSRFDGNNIYAYVDINNRNANSLACNIINEIVLNSGLKFDTFMVYAIDTSLEKSDNHKIFDNSIYFDIGSLAIFEGEEDSSIYSIYYRSKVSEIIADEIMNLGGES